MQAPTVVRAGVRGIQCRLTVGKKGQPSHHPSKVRRCGTAHLILRNGRKEGPAATWKAGHNVGSLRYQRREGSPHLAEKMSPKYLRKVAQPRRGVRSVGCNRLHRCKNGELSRGAGASEGGYLERARHAEVASASHAVISRRILQFSMLAEVISGSDDAKLAELVLQLHTPVEKLRQWETRWRRISGQEQPGKANGRASAMSACHGGDRQNLAALEAGDESVGPHGEWQYRQR